MIAERLKLLVDSITKTIREKMPEYEIYILGQDEEPPDGEYCFLLKLKKCNLRMVTNRKYYLEYYFDIMFIGEEIIYDCSHKKILDNLKSYLIYPGIETTSGATLKAKEYTWELKLIDGVSHFYITYDFLVNWGDIFDQQNN